MSDDREQNTIYTQENPSRQNQPLESFDILSTPRQLMYFHLLLTRYKIRRKGKPSKEHQNYGSDEAIGIPVRNESQQFQSTLYIEVYL